MGLLFEREGRSTLSLEYIDLYDYKSTASLSGMLARIMLTVSAQFQPLMMMSIVLLKHAISTQLM